MATPPRRLFLPDTCCPIAVVDAGDCSCFWSPDRVLCRCTRMRVIEFAWCGHAANMRVFSSSDRDRDVRLCSRLLRRRLTSVFLGIGQHNKTVRISEQRAPSQSIPISSTGANRSKADRCLYGHSGVTPPPPPRPFSPFSD